MNHHAPRRPSCHVPLSPRDRPLGSELVSGAFTGGGGRGGGLQRRRDQTTLSTSPQEGEREQRARATEVEQQAG
eukprot:3581642-Rhodomonas_salina.1